MDKTLIVHVFETLYELNGQHQSSLEREFVPTKLKEISKTWSHQLHSHEVGIFLLAITVNLGKALHILHVFTNLSFVLDYLVVDVVQ